MNSERLVWYWHRLRSMPQQELLHRVQEAYRLRRPVAVATVSSKLCAPRFLEAEPRLVEVWQTFWSDAAEQHSYNQALEAIGGQISVFGHAWSTRERMWNVDPVSHYKWPQIPAYKLDYRHNDGADPKWVWEINRLLFLLPIAFSIKAGSIDRQKGEQFISETILDWIANCRVGHGPQWSASIEVAIRSIAMTLSVQVIQDPDEGLIEAVAKSIHEHATWIRRFPSVYSSANNHRIAEIAALLILDSSWVGILDTDEAIELERELAHVSRRLFAADGLGLEQSPTYGAFSIEFLAIVMYTRRWCDDTSRGSIAEILAQACHALSQLTNEDGSLIRYGDDDEGKVITLAVPDSAYAESLVRLGTGSRGQREQGLISFDDGGLSLLRFQDNETETTWLFDHGPLGFGELAAHGHADALSVGMRTAGIDWIVDAGTYRYHGDKRWRSYFRSSKAHNAPRLDDLDSSVMTGAFNWHKKMRAEAKLIASQTDGTRARIHATHDGYARQGLGGVARKLERLAEGHYRITDTSDGRGSLSTAFVLNPNCEVSLIANGWLLTHPASPVCVELTVSNNAELVSERPEDELAWFSPRFGMKVATWRIGAVCNGQHVQGQGIVFDFKILNTVHLEA